MKNLQTVSGVFFFCLGAIYFLLALVTYNQQFLPTSQILFNILDLPFALVALLYGGSSLWTALDEHQAQTTLSKTLILGLGIVIFSTLLVINFAFTDAI